MLRKQGLLLACGALTLLVYARVLFYGHISWDDPEMVFRNADVRSFALADFFTSQYVGNYLPLSMVAHAITWAIFGPAEAGHHLLSICIHILNGILVFRLTQGLLRNEGAALFTAAVFLLHPVQVESVAWISELKNLLYATFFLGGLLVYCSPSFQGRKKYLLTLTLFILSCLCKPSAVIFPLVLIAMDHMRGVTHSWRTHAGKLPFFVVAAAFGAVNLYTQSADRFINYAHAYPFVQRVGMAGYALAKYFQLFFLPVRLSVIYPYPEAEAQYVVGGYFFIAVLIMAGVFFYRTKKVLPGGMLLFVISNLVLVLQLIPFGEALYADRYMYLAIVGMAWLLIPAFSALRANLRMVTVAVAVVLAVASFVRCGKWRSALTLYEDIIKKYPDNFVALNSAGVESMFAGDDRKAFTYLQQAIEAGPRNYKGHYNLGLLLLKMQMPDRAIESFNRSLALYDYAKAYTGRATAYYIKGDLAKAVNDAEKSAALSPRNAKAYFVLGNCYNDMNELEKAKKAFDKAIELDGGEAEYYYKRGIVMGKKQDFKRCIADLQLALHLNPRLYDVHYWLGVAKTNLGEPPCRDFQIAARHGNAPALKAYNSMCK